MHSGESVADFEIRLAGKALTGAEKGDVLSISVDRGIHMPDRYEVLLTDIHGRWSKLGEIKIGSKIEIDLGYVGKLKNVGKGTIAFIETILARDGTREFRLVGYGPRYILQRGVGNKRFEDGAVGNSVAQASGGHGATVSLDKAGMNRPYLIQANQAGGHLLEEWASRLGLVVLEDAMEVQAALPELSGTGPTFTYETDLREFRVEVNTFQQVSKVKVTGVDPASKAQFVGMANKDDNLGLMGGTTSGTEAAEKAFGAVTLEVSNMPVKTQEEADRLAAALYNNRLYEFITGHGLGRGEPTLKAGGVVTLENLGSRISGMYYVVRAVQHYAAGSGYWSSFEVVRPAWGTGGSTGAGPGSGGGKPGGAGGPGGPGGGGPGGGGPGGGGPGGGGPGGGGPGGGGPGGGGPGGGGPGGDGPGGNGPGGDGPGGDGPGGGDDPEDPPKPPEPPKPVKLIKLTPIIGNVTAADWVCHHHATLFVELVVKGPIQGVRIHASPFDQWVNYPMLCGVWQTPEGGDWHTIQRMVVGVVGQAHGGGRPCRMPNGPHGDGWMQMWSPYNSNKGWVDVNLTKGRYVIAVYARNTGTILMRVTGQHADAIIKDQCTLHFSGQHPSPGD